VNYLYPKQVLYLYQQIIAQSGSSPGVRDEGLLESAVYRPQASFGGQDLYPELFTKTAALGHSLIHSHPCVDGNKRLGFEAMRLMLRLNGYDLQASTEAKVTFALDIAKGKFTEQGIADWLKAHNHPYQKYRN